MSWLDDLKEIKYTSPSGQEFTFFYDNLSVDVDKKTASFIFPEKDGAYIQDLGRAGRRFPFTCYFSGETYNKDADNFMLALEEAGIGKLDHPLYGTRNVVPTGSITRRDDLISEANQAIFSFTLSETLKDLFFPETKENAIDNISNSLNNSTDKISTEFSDSIKFDNAGDNVSLITQMKQQLATIDSKLKTAAKTLEKVNSAYQQIKTAYENNIENILTDAESVARQAIEIIRLPSRVNQDVKLKLQTYKDLITHLKSDFAKALDGVPNAFYETNKNLMSCLIASNEAILYQNFKTRNECIEVSEMLLDMFDDLKLFQDENYDSLGLVDIGSGYEALLRSMNYSTGYLINESFSLPSEKKIVLGNSSDIFSLVNSIYGNLDNLDDFIINNDLTADEIEQLPAKREIVYYQ